jgi:hypothetical protein
MRYCALFLLCVFTLAREANDVDAAGRVTWPREYAMEILRPAVTGGEAKNYLSGVVQNLIADQLSLQRSAVTRGRVSPLTIEYSLQRDHEALPQGERELLLARYPKPEILPLRIRREPRISPKVSDCTGLPPDQYTLLTSIAASGSRVEILVSLCQGSELLHAQKTSTDEQELVAAVQRLVNPVRKKLTGDNYASLRIESNPPQASVYLDDQFLGKTPLNYSYLIPGTYQLVLKRNGYLTKSETLRPRAGDEMKLLLELEPAPIGGSLEISTTPPGAKIYLDADYYGKTPKRIENIAAGTYRLHLLHPEKGEVYRSVTLNEKNSTLKIDENLTGFLSEQQPGFIGLHYKTWYYMSLVTSAACFGAGIAFYVWRDAAQEQIFGRLSGKPTSFYTQEDRDFLAARMSEYELRGNYATAFMLSSGVFALLSLYFYVEHLLSQDEGIVMHPGRQHPGAGEVEYRIGSARGIGEFSANYRF